MPLGEPGLDGDDPTLAELLDHGFIELRGNPATHAVAVPLSVALERALSGLQAQFLDQQRQLVEARAYFDTVAPRFARAQDAVQPGSYLTGSFAELVAEAARTAEVELAGWNVAWSRTPPASADVAVRVRRVCDTAFLRWHGGVGPLQEAHAAGDEVRIAPELPTSVAIVDSATVVIGLDGLAKDGVGSSQGVMVGSALVAGAMRELFEQIWQRALPWTSASEADEILTPIEHRVAALMAVGRTDEEIAVHLSMSVRTVRRHVASVAQRLGAGTRFAAGVAAARSGLLDDTDMS